MIFNKYTDLFFIKFPIFLPVMYLSALFIFPNYGTAIALVTMLLLAEPHFGATWTIFFDKKMFLLAIDQKIYFLWVPLALAIFFGILFFFSPSVFYLLFFCFNIYHVSRQSVGICKLYSKNQNERNFQELTIYVINIIIFFGILTYHLIKVLDKDQAFNLGIILLLSASLISTYQFYKYKNLETAVTTFTGMAIFIPAFFVSEPIHALLAGVTMHYSQYIVMTIKITLSKREEYKSTKVFGTQLMSLKSYLFIILIYGAIATVLSAYSMTLEGVLSNLIFIPILGQLLHFYIDGLIWKFKDQKMRNINLRYLLS